MCRIVVNVLVRCREQPTSGESIVGAGRGAKFNTRKKKTCYEMLHRDSELDRFFENA